MKRSYLLVTVAAALAASLFLPAVAAAFEITGGGGTQTRNPYGLWYAGQEACALEGCHSAIAATPSPHSSMVTDVKTFPSALRPSASSPLWPYANAAGGLVLRPRDMYLQIGDGQGFLEYVGASGSALAPNVVPADDIFVWSPMEYLFAENSWAEATATIGYGSYSQSCSGCHNLGVTRPSNASYTLANGAVQSTSTPSSVSAFSIQCEVCHGTGKTPDGHKKGVPAVVGGVQMLKAQVCGQCHVTATATQKNAAGKAFTNPNGYTTDATLSAYLTPATTVDSETTFMDYVNNGGAKPKFLPNGANYSMRHSYYNEWLVSGHAASPQPSILANRDPRCLRCHSGTGYLYRIGAKGPDGKRLIAAEPTTATAAANDPGISCQVCHTGHVGYRANGGYDSTRKKPGGSAVSCGDCHNWRYEMLDYPLQYESIGGVEYTRPALNQRPHIPQREIVAGGWGGDDGRGGLWGVAPMGEFMPNTTCTDCHMPRTSKEGMPANDDGSDEATRLSHRFRVVLPGDAARWKLRPNGDSCTARCHKQEAADYTRADFQTWVDETSATVAAASDEASVALAAVGAPFGFTRYRLFESAQPTTGLAAALDPARWAMLQHAAQNLNMVTADGSSGLHNPAYARAGLRKATLWAKSASATVDATIGVGLASGSGMTVSGTLMGVGDGAIPGAVVSLEMSVDGGTRWSSVATTQPSPVNGRFALNTGRIVGSRLYRCSFAPSVGVLYSSKVMSVNVPVTSASFLPATAPSGWLNATLVTATLRATRGSLTYYTLSGATTKAVCIYLGVAPVPVAAEGLTTLTYWSVGAQGVEAPTSVALRLDRSAPVVLSDAVAGYLDRATVRTWATDRGSGVAKLEYSLDTSAFRPAAGTWATVTTSRLGTHTLVVRTTDKVGKMSSRAWTFRVRTQPRLTVWPMSSSYTVTLGGTLTTKATLRTRSGGRIVGKGVYLQRSGNAISWRNYAARVTNSTGQVGYVIKPTRRGTTYWRWYVPTNDTCTSATGAKTRLVTR